MEVVMNYTGFFSIGLVVSLMIVSGLAGEKQQKEFREMRDLRPGGSLTVNSVRGNVSITAWDENRVELVTTISPPTGVSEDYANRAVEGVRIEMTGNEESLSIRANYDGVPKGDGKFPGSRTFPEVYFHIRAPRSLSLRIEADLSRVNLSGLVGSFDLQTDRTDLGGNDLAGELKLRMGRGNARFSRINGTLDVKGERGEILFEMGELTGDSKIEMNRGSISLNLPEKLGFFVSAQLNNRNDFTSNFPITMQVMKQKKIEGLINGGGPKLLLKAERGRVYLNHK